MSTLFDFGWDDRKARTNLAKHKVSFRLATSVFNDPLALTIFDDDHSGDEDRWVTLGRGRDGVVLAVVHTTEDMSAAEVRIRIISARRADRSEIRDYEDVPR